MKSLLRCLLAASLWLASIPGVQAAGWLPLAAGAGCVKTVTDLGNVSNGGSGGLTTLTTPALLAAVAVGSPVVVFVNFSNTTTPTPAVTDTKGNSYSLVVSLTGFNGNYVYYARIPDVGHALSTSDTITFTDSTSTGFQFGSVTAISAPGYTTVDTAVTASNNTFANSYSLNSNTPAAVTNELNLGFGVANSSFTGTPTGWTINPPTAPGTSIMIGKQINTGTGALNWAGSTSGVQNIDSFIIAIKPSC